MYRVQLTVPSTKNTSESISNREFNRRVTQVLNELSERFGGATAVDATGSWKSNGLLITERVKQVYSWTESDNTQELRKLAKELCAQWAQEAVMLEVNNNVYFEVA